VADLGPGLMVWLPATLVRVPTTLYVVSPRSQGRLAAKPTIGTVKPLLSRIRLRPLENSS